MLKKRQKQHCKQLMTGNLCKSMLYVNHSEYIRQDVRTTNKQRRYLICKVFLDNRKGRNWLSVDLHCKTLLIRFLKRKKSKHSVENSALRKEREKGRVGTPLIQALGRLQTPRDTTSAVITRADLEQRQHQKTGSLNPEDSAF